MGWTSVFLEITERAVTNAVRTCGLTRLSISIYDNKICLN